MIHFLFGYLGIAEEDVPLVITAGQRLRLLADTKVPYLNINNILYIFLFLKRRDH